MKSYRSLGYRIAGAIILAAAGVFQAIPASFAYSRSWTLAGLTVQVGTYLPITLDPQLNVLESQDASGSVFAEWIQLHHPKGSPLPDYYLKVSNALAQGNVTIPMQNLSGNPIRVLGLGLSPSFDVYKGGPGNIFFKTYQNGCRKIDFTAKRDADGNLHLWRGTRAIRHLKIVTTATNISVQGSTIQYWDGATEVLNLGILPASVCP